MYHCVKHGSSQVRLDSSMKKILIIANWKSNKNEKEAWEWLSYFESEMHPESVEGKEIIICPSFPLLPVVKSFIKSHGAKIRIGAQDISSFNKGAYTGEVNGNQIKEYAEYVLIGHSERRKELGESDELLEKKVGQALESELKPIFCVEDKNTFIPQNIRLVAYEPVFAVNSGNPDTPKNANTVAEKIKRNHAIEYVMYGGSVTGKNVHSFTQMPHVNGVLVGRASLDPKEFIEIIKHV